MARKGSGINLPPLPDPGDGAIGPDGNGLPPPTPSVVFAPPETPPLPSVSTAKGKILAAAAGLGLVVLIVLAYSH